MAQDCERVLLVVIAWTAKARAMKCMARMYRMGSLNPLRDQASVEALFSLIGRKHTQKT